MALNLTFEEQEGNRLKLVWMGENWKTTYSVGIESVRMATTAVREVLDKIAEHYRTCVSPSYAGFLQELAIAGRALADSLFDNIVDGDKAEVTQAREDIFGGEGRQALNVYSDMSVHVPWGFAFEADPWKLPTLNGTLADFDGFWLNRFVITVRCNSATQLRPPVRQHENFRVLYAIHKQLHEDAVRNLLPTKKAALMQLLNRKVGTSTDWIDCKQKWDQIVDNDSVFYIFGHSDGQSIALGAEDSVKDRINTVIFRSTFKKKSGSRTATICFVNGCGTARGILDASFLNAASGPGYHGFIGTEAEVSNEFATIYGMEFMTKLCDDGRSVQEAIQELRAQLFPLSLFYSCFANPDFRIAR